MHSKQKPVGKTNGKSVFPEKKKKKLPQMNYICALCSDIDNLIQTTTSTQFFVSEVMWRTSKWLPVPPRERYWC